MATAWGGADPVEVVDAADYELGVEYLVNETVTITHLRVWSGPNETSVANRRARIWTTAGAQLAIATLADTLPDGWSQYELDSPLERTAGQRIIVSYSSGGNYGARASGLTSNVNSTDGAVTALSSANATAGNGSFNLTPGTFPDTASGNSSFYGPDFVYTLGSGGNTAPRVTELTAISLGATVTATAVVEDDETLTGATYRYTWGDGEADTTGTLTAQHTYAESGLYAVMFRVTDAGGLVGTKAAPVLVTVPSAELNDLDYGALVAAVKSHAQSSGRFQRVAEHEFLAAPGDGLSLAIMLGPAGITPVRTSGLRITSARVELLARVYLNANSTPAKDLDARVIAAGSDLMKRISGDFTVGGEARHVDLLSAYGEPLQARPGWLPYADGSMFRVVDVTIPVILNDVYEQVP